MRKLCAALALTLTLGLSACTPPTNPPPTTPPTSTTTTSATPTPPVTTPPVTTPPVTTPPAVPVTQQVEITYYGSYDNDPKGSLAIDHPVLHQTAGGTGTYADPLTFASPAGVGEYPYGLRIYVPSVQKYFIREDSCAQSWTATDGCGAVTHVDLYVGNPSGTKDVLKCEDSLTPDGLAPIVINPSADLLVDSAPLWVEATKTCHGTASPVTTPPVTTPPVTTPPVTTPPVTTPPVTTPPVTTPPVTTPPVTTPPVTTPPVTTPPVTTPAPPPVQGRVYPWHTNIVSTTFWVGEIFDASLPDGSQVCSTYDSQWAFHWSGVNNGKVPSSAGGCAGSIVGGCDGVPSANKCDTEARKAANGFFPTKVTPKENPFYLDLPFDDVNDSTGFKTRCSVIPWANDPGYAGKCGDSNFSYMKNRFVRIVGPNGHTCYGQIEDAGPSHGSLYHDSNYVFGAKDAQPVQGQFNNAGADVSPALNGCLRFSELDGEGDHIKWQFVDRVDIPAGDPALKLITTSPFTP